jgi:hypothetical protein
MSITSIEEYEAALRRITELEDFPEGSPQAAELAKLIRAVTDWNKAQENADR